MPTKPKTNYSTPDGEINPKDTFQTPAYALDPLLPYIERFDRVWESAHGQGYLVRALCRAGKTVIASDLATGCDFFHCAWMDTDIPDELRPQCQITNVPFSRKFDWIARSIMRTPRSQAFALLVPSDVLFAGQKCIPLIERYGLEMLVPTQRIKFCTPERGWDDSRPQMNCGWLTYGLNIGRRLTYVKLNFRPEEPLTRNLLDWKPDRPNQLRIFRPGSL